MNDGRHRCSGPLPRREFVVAGSIGMLGLTWPQLLRGQEPLRTPRTLPGFGRARAVIFIFLDGGMSHLDTLDPKPDAPVEYRGEFNTIATSLPGVRVGEHLPQLARQIHRATLVRSMGHRARFRLGDEHHPGCYYYLTGHVPDASFSQGLSRRPLPDDRPFIGSVVASKVQPARPVPPLVALPKWSTAANGDPIRPGQFGGVLGRVYDPLLMQGSDDRPSQFTAPPTSLPGDISLTRLESRKSLLRQLDARARQVEAAREAAVYDRHQAKAYSLLRDAAPPAFDLMREPERLRARYGENINGQSMLLARRLVEAGVPFVSVFWKPFWSGFPVGPNYCGGWDTHEHNFYCLRHHLLPPLDTGLSALLEDLGERGLLDQTLVVLVSEMGRRPRVGDGTPDGRGHWLPCHTVLLAGAGIKRGFVFGSSDAKAAYPRTDPVGPEDLHATIYHALGLDPTITAPDGRTINLLDDGRPLLELFA